MEPITGILLLVGIMIGVFIAVVIVIAAVIQMLLGGVIIFLDWIVSFYDEEDKEDEPLDAWIVSKGNKNREDFTS